MLTRFLQAGRCWLALPLFLIVVLTGCSTYVTPGGPAPLNAVSRAAGADSQAKAGFDRKPAARFPAHLVATRVQAAGYRSYSSHGYGSGKYSVVTVRDVESAADYQRITGWKGVAQLGTLNRMLLPERIESVDDLRGAAAQLQADIVLLYTVDTQFIDRNSSALLTTISLGFGPTHEVQINSTASALFVDVRTGFVYGAAEASSSQANLSSVWRSASAADEARQAAEKAAFRKLMDELEPTWAGIANRYGQAPAQP
jgi:hypothetical protein